MHLPIRPTGGDRAYLLAPGGGVAHEWATCAGMTNWSYLLSDRNLFRNERCENRKGAALTVSGRMSEHAPDSRLIRRHDGPYQHHDVRRTTDGAVYAAFSEVSDETKTRIRGGRPGSETPGGPYGEVLRRVVDEKGLTIWEWSLTELGLDTHELFPNSTGGALATPIQ